MISYRNQLKKIGCLSSTSVHYNDFYYRPTSLRQAMKAMDAPQSYKQETEGEGGLNKGWTEEIQGVAWDGSHWIFSSNGSQPVEGFPEIGSSPKALYTFDGHTNFEDPNSICVIAKVHPFKAAGSIEAVIPVPTGEISWINHIGPMAYHNGVLYVEHWNTSGGQLIAFTNNNGVLSFKDWIFLESVEGARVSIVGFDFENNIIYTCHGNKNIDRIFMHKLNSDGKSASYTNREMNLNPGISDGCYVQGGFFSPNGHLYISSGRKGTKSNYQNIYCYSALNGFRVGVIPVLAQESNQELEGIFYAPMIRNKKAVQIHAVLLENYLKEKDDIFFKSFSASEPDLI